MHEFSVMSELVGVLKHEIENKNILSVKEVVVSVGELSFLAEEQLRFAYGVLTETIGPLKDSIFTFEDVKAEVACRKCSYTGGVEYLGSDEDHFRMPIINCPECGGQVSVISGRGCMIKNMVAIVED